ncbi:hypothetical protein V8G54_013507 [Vigna mungo]|uniref:Uncharacterized protein n=1 Tax=Vigna mungo TaxID=3915 RepID=A0AAQ3NT21_VIGMU
MGRNVFSVSHEGSSFLRAYDHYSKKGHGITLLLINMSNSTTLRVSLVNDMHTDKEGGSSDAIREEYHLTPKDGNIQSEVLDIREMNPKLVDPSSTIKVKPDSIVFMHSKSFCAPACS